MKEDKVAQIIQIVIIALAYGLYRWLGYEITVVILLAQISVLIAKTGNKI